MPNNICIFYVGFFAMIAACVYSLGSGVQHSLRLMLALLLIPSVEWRDKK